MQTRFLESMIKLGFPNAGKPILLGVSGGVDSMVLASLLHDADYKIGIAHCNYQLRGKDSDDDQNLVENWCLERGIPFHLKKVETEKLAKLSDSSVQMIAREERYSFFKELLEKYGYGAVALAHHANDRVESLLLNVLRGTGFRGFQGMPSKRDEIIRPLLGFRKREIRQFAEENDISFREDTSNQQTYYQRNWVRLKLMPMLEAAQPEAFNKCLDFCGRSENELDNYQNWIEVETSKIKTDNGISVELMNSKAPFTILKEILEPIGFNSDLVFEVMDILDSASGSEVLSDTHRVIKDRNELIISPIGIRNEEPQLGFHSFSRKNLENLKTESNVALLDADKLDVSKLKLRKWVKGDKFKPLGMDRWKLLSDFFIDKKVSNLEKEHTWLMTCDNEIVWVIGHRIDNRFKVTDNTQKVLKVTL